MSALSVKAGYGSAVDSGGANSSLRVVTNAQQEVDPS